MLISLLTIFSIKKPAEAGIFESNRLFDRCAHGVPINLANKLSQVAAFILTAKGVPDLDLAGASGALVFGLGDIALGNLDRLARLYVVKGDTHELVTSVRFVLEL